MTAAPLLRCSACRGAPHRYDEGCPACDDSALRADRSGDAQVHEYATERVEARLRAALLHMQRSDAASLAGSLARLLAYEPGDPVRAVMVRGGVDRTAAHKLLSVYAAAIREHAVAVRSGAGAGWDRVEDGRAVAERCELHAGRIEAALPRWMR